MESLKMINAYSKYAYIVLGIAIIVLLIVILVKLANIGKSIKPINDDAILINKHLDDLNSKEEIIKHTTETSLPFFIKVYFGISFSVHVLKDYFDTKPSKRSLKKSIKRTYKLKKSI